MQASHYSIDGHGFVVLYEVDGADFLFKFSLGEALEEVASGVFEDMRFDNDYSVYICFDNVHIVISLDS